MDYNDFLNYLISHLNDYFKDSATIACHKILKNNDVYYDALMARSDTSNISATIYVNRYFEQYGKGRHINEILKEIKEIFEKNINQKIDLSYLSDFSNLESQIAIKLINYESNAKLLSLVPHILFHDLALVFYIIINTPPFTNSTVLIHNYHLDKWQINIDVLYHAARKNTPSLLGYEIIDMDDIIKEFMIQDIKESIYSKRYRADYIINNELISRFADDVLRDLNDYIPKKTIFVLTGKNRTNGACFIIYPEILERFAANWNCDIYILPSSIHEVILIPATLSPSASELGEMVREINKTEVAPTERLSDNVYLYSFADKAVNLVTEG
ncbi:MAG: hypothetical protein IJM37_06600 [Lachnospiraceae bacterium]|nr:hypothetical protein [Lachnospiraceae bacterium]